MPTSLTQALIETKAFSATQLQELENEAKAAGISLEELLMKKKLIKEKDLLILKSKVFNWPLIDLRGQTIQREILRIIPEEVAQNYQMIAFGKDSQSLEIAFVDPSNLPAIEAAEFLAESNHLKLKFYLISPSNFKEIFKQYRVLSEEAKVALEAAKEKLAVSPPKKEKKEIEIEEVIKRAPVSKMVEVIIKHAVEGGASDIHIEPLDKESRVRYRIDGILYTSLLLPKYIHSALISRIKVMSNLKIDETRLPQDGRIRQSFEGKDIDFRISVLPLTDHEKVVMRILDVTRGAPTLEEIGFMGQNLEIIKENIKKPTGMLLVTGPTGSGKSTTLFSVLTMLNREEVNISTLEDPVEYYIKGVNQSQIRSEIGFTFAGGLRALLRQDPNIILVGEIRDRETAELAIHSALTGHLILSTLHTNDAIGASPRLMDMGVEPFLLASTLNIIIAQRLVRRICPECKTKTELPKSLEEEIKKELSNISLESYELNLNLKKSLVFYKGRGCVNCANLGYKGRIAITEIINITETMKKIMIEGNKIDQVKEELVKQKFISLKQDGLIKALAGLTTVEEIMRVTKE